MATIAEFFDWLLVQEADQENRFYSDPGAVIDEFQQQYGDLENRDALESLDIKQIREAIVSELATGTREADAIVIRARMT